MCVGKNIIDIANENNACIALLGDNALAVCVNNVKPYYSNVIKMRINMLIENNDFIVRCHKKSKNKNKWRIGYEF